MSGRPGSAIPIPGLTGIRGAAAVGVFLSHIYGQASIMLGWPALNGSALLANAFRGVDLFFILSGFILMHVHSEDFISLDGPAIRSFLVVRFFRVYPLNTFVLLLMVPLALFAPGYVVQSRTYTDPHLAYNAGNMSLPGFIQSLLLVQTWTLVKLGAWNGPAWTLSAEVLGYLAFPILACFARRQDRPGRCILLAGLALTALVVALAAGHHLGRNDNPSGTFGAIRMAGCFTAGVLTCRAYQLLGDRADHVATWTTILALLFLALTLFDRRATTLDVFGFAVLVFGLASRRGPVNAVLGSGLLVWLGKISFSFYLLHELIISLLEWRFSRVVVQQNMWTGFSILAGLTGCCLAAGWLTFHLVERPSQRFGRRVERLVRPRPMFVA